MTAPGMSICPRCNKLFAAMERCDCSFYFSKHGYGFIYRGYYIDTILEIATCLVGPANTGIWHDNGFSLDLGYVLPPDVSEDELDKILLLI